MSGDEQGPEARHLAFLAEGRFMLQRARASGRFIFPPRVMEPGTGDPDLEWVEASGFGTVHSTTVLHPRPPAAPYNLCLVDLEEGARMLARVEDVEPGEVTVGMRVEAFLAEENGSPLVLFQPAEENPLVNADTPPPPPSAVPLPRFAGEDPKSRTASALDPPPFTGEGDQAKRGGGGVPEPSPSSSQSKSRPSEPFPRARTAIAGVSTWGIGEMPGYSSIEMAAQASRLALADAGISLAEVDGLFLCLPDDFLSGLAFSEYLGIAPTLTDNNRTGGSAFLTHAIAAALALDAGLIDVALIAYGSNQRSNAGRLVSALAPSVYEAPYRAMMPVAGYALAAARHMFEFGTTREQLAHVAVSARQWAKLNPEAFMRGDLSIDDCLAARMVAAPLGVRDCCLVTDGAAAIVMTRADRARDGAKAPVYLLGGAAEITHKEIAAMPSLVETGARRSGERAYAQAKVGPRDIDTVQLYDAFTINTILFLEDLGFCARGEGGQFVASGAIAPGGSLPVNTNGGGLSCVHPGMYGLFTMVEAVRQLRGEAGARQVTGPELALCHGNGGVLSSQVTTILGTSAAL